MTIKLSALTSGQKINTASGTGNMDNIIIGATTPVASTFTNITATGLVFESNTTNITAATGGQAGATALTTEINNVTTCTAGYGVALPAATSGLTVYVINSSANPLKVYGNNAGADTIDGIATGTGVTQMVNSLCLYSCDASGPSGKWVSNGVGTGYSGSLQTLSYADGLIANSGGVQAGATAITTLLARFTTVGGAGYSSVLPTAVPGLNLIIINAGANAMNVFPAGTDAINALAASAAFSQGANSNCEYVCTIAGQWHTAYSSNLSTGTGSNVFAVSPTISNLVLQGSALAQKAYTANSSTAYTIDPANGGQLDLTLNGVTPVLTLQSVVAGQSVVLPVTLIQDGTGSRVPSFVNVTWAANVAPTISSAAGTKTYLSFISDGVTWTGYATPQTTGTGAVVQATSPLITTPSVSGNITQTSAAGTLLLKQGSNGKCGTFVANGVTPVVISNTSIAITDTIIISLNTIGGTVGVQPHVSAITANTSFAVTCTATDTSTYNYAIISNAP